MTDSTKLLEFEYDEIDTPLGRLTLVADQSGRLRLVGWHEGHERMDRALRAYAGGPRYALRRGDNPHGFSAALRAYFSGQLDAIDSLSVCGEGSEFQRRVWSALREIPCGATWSYSELARHIGNAAAVRAVGLANGANPVGIVVPCHRVIGANGTLTGYGGGLERKRWLLQHERARISVDQTSRAGRPAATVRA
ncbi:MAG: methylated-DNA--[protein]-cysteine S-methyltransferase [Deltaproteobacteria bacterium]